MNDPLEKLLKKMELSCYGKESDLIYRGDALNAIRGACIMAHIPFNSSSPEGRRTMEAIKAVWKVKSASTYLHGGWKNAKTEPPPPNTDVEVYCKALGVTVGYHRPLMDEWLTDDHRTLRNVTHWRPIPPPPPEAEP